MEALLHKRDAGTASKRPGLRRRPAHHEVAAVFFPPAVAGRRRAACVLAASLVLLVLFVVARDVKQRPKVAFLYLLCQMGHGSELVLLPDLLQREDGLMRLGIWDADLEAVWKLEIEENPVSE